MVNGTSKHASERGLDCDILVVGGGPAGLALASEFAARGVSVSLVSPDLGERWDRSYGAFVSELAGLGVEGAITRMYTAPLVYADDGQAIRLETAYARFDTSLLQALLFERCGKRNVRMHRGTVQGVQFDSRAGCTRATALLAPGPGEDLMESRTTELSAKLVVNAAGAGTDFEDEKRRVPSGYQSAYGLWLQVDAQPFGEGEMALMDYRAIGQEEAPATFLYAMPETGEPGGPGTLFVQETTLVADAPVPMSLLADRLQARLTKMGLDGNRVLGTERCVIPMGGGLPPESSLTLPFGAAAGFVHPATGYQLIRAIRCAPEVAEAVTGSLSHGPYEAVQAGLRVMWPSERRRAWRVFELGAQALSALPPEQMRRFVRDFFSLGGGRWQRFMAGTMEATEIAESMWRVFAHAPPRLRAQLIRGGSVATARLLAPRLN